MVLVCASHIKHHFESTAPALTWFLTATTRIATPTFLLLSGLVIAYLLRTDARGTVAISLVDRALFLLIVAHALLGLAELPEAGIVQWYFGRAMLTDAVGVALIIAVLLRAASASALMVLGLSLCLASWIVAMTITFESSWAQTLGSILFSMRSPNIPWANLPLVPYVGMFLMGMGLSVSLLPALRAGSNGLIVRHLLVIGSVALLAVVIGILIWRSTKEYLPEALREADVYFRLRQTINPMSRDPPSPAYLAFYGGSGVLMLAVFFYGRPTWLIQLIATRAAVIGKASLLTFIIQDWLFFVLPKAFGYDEVQSVPFWFAYLAVCVCGLYLAAKAWNRAQGNRVLTIGLKALMHRRQAHANLEAR